MILSQTLDAANGALNFGVCHAGYQSYFVCCAHPLGISMFTLCQCTLEVWNVGFNVTGAHSEEADRVSEETVHVHFLKMMYLLFSVVCVCMYV